MLVKNSQARGSSVQKNACHRLSHRCTHLRDFAHAHIYNSWNSKFRMSISNTPHDRIGARNMILQIKQQLAPVTNQGSKLSESNLRASLPRNQTCSEESASIK